MRKQNLVCLPRSKNIVGSSNIKENDNSKIWFDSRDPSVFEELYSFYTGQSDYMIPILSEENDYEQPESEVNMRYSGARTFDTKNGPPTVSHSQRS